MLHVENKSLFVAGSLKNNSGAKEKLNDAGFVCLLKNNIHQPSIHWMDGKGCSLTIQNPFLAGKLFFFCLEKTKLNMSQSSLFQTGP